MWLDNKKAVLLQAKPRTAAAVLFDLKFADNIHYSLRVAKLRKPFFGAPNIQKQNRI